MTTPKPAARKPESPDKVRWMLWLPKTTLEALRGENARTGTPVAKIIRDVADARAELPAETVEAYTVEAERKGVTVTSLFVAALKRGAPKTK